MKKYSLALITFIGSTFFPAAHAASTTEECKRLFDEAEYQQALAPCIEAARSNDLESQSILGELYDRKGNSKNTYYWWNRAATAGYLPARNQLAMKLYYGGSVFGPEKGWTQDYARAYSIWLQDARKGHTSAQFMVADMLFHGQGVKADYAEAWAWFNLALEQGYKLASDSLIELKRKMSPQQKQRGKAILEAYRKRINQTENKPKPSTI